jgi:putative transposase
MKIDQTGNELSIPKFREGIKCKVHRKFEGLIRQVTVSRTPTGKYFVSALFEDAKSCKPKKPVTEKNTVGIDLGLKTFIVTSDKEQFANPRFLKKSLNKLKYTQRKYSLYKGEKTKQRLALIHEKVANQRKDFLHKVSAKLIRENQSIAVENLNVKGMLKNHRLAQSIQDVSWGMFSSMLEYKAEWYGTNILKIGRFDPSSKTCNSCGYIKKDMTLADRVWTCPICLVQHDRDINAAINVKNFALRNYMCEGLTLKNHKELPTLVGASTYEDTTL